MRNARNVVLRELAEGERRLKGRGGGLSIEELAGQEIVGARLEEGGGDDGAGLSEGTVFVGNITIDGEEVPVTAYEEEVAGKNVSVIFVGDVVVGNLSTSRALVRTLTCAKIASVANDAAYDPEAKVAICEFVEQNCAPRRGLINYMAWSYCGPLEGLPHLGGVLLLLWVGVLLVWLAAEVDFLVPALHTCSDVFGMRQSVAGVTFLAFGNGCADLFGMLAATLSGPAGLELAVGEVLGNGMFVFCGVQGVVALMGAFRVDGAEYVRDCASYGLSVGVALAVLWDGKINAWEGGAMLLAYAAYVMLVLRFDDVRPLLGLGEREGGADAGEAHEDERKAARGRAARYNRIVEASPAGAPCARALWLYLFPFDDDEPFKSLPPPQLALALVRAPVVFFMKATVPVVDRSLPRMGWVRPAMTLHAFFVPFVLAAFAIMQDGLPDWAYEGHALALILALCLALGGAAAVALWVSTEEALGDGADAPPSYHRYLGILGFAMALVWIFATAREIVNAILAFGVVFEVGSLVLGVTVLAVGIGMQDLVTCVGIARAGLPAMAASSCVGSSLLNILLGLGIAGVVNGSMSEPSELYVSLQLLVCVLFMLLSVAVAVLYMHVQGYEAGPVFGGVLVGIYVMFVVSSLVVGVWGDAMLARAKLAISTA